MAAHTQSHPQTVDHELIEVATRVSRDRCFGDNHTVAAAGRSADGEIVTAVNVYHFTGGPCAELVLIGAAVTQGITELRTVVAIGDGGEGVIPPCGRCRQVLLDLHPKVEVIVGRGAECRSVPIRGLLPESFVWADHQLPDDAPGA
ncbi:cytidine deaminase [Streptomyces sp. NPDC091371]|uniref:cytidine deaminase family protein n=1 Tax=Streptomyces sp. NPDC091371 TaxID=3155303 RepID=UPI0034366D26